MEDIIHRNVSYHPENSNLKSGGRTFQKLSHLLGGQIFCYKGGINLKMGVDVKMRGGGATLFTTLQFSSVTFTVWGE